MALVHYLVAGVARIQLDARPVPAQLPQESLRLDQVTVTFGTPSLYSPLMKALTLPSIALISLVVLGSAGTATAAPSQSLQSTAPYKSLKNYVSMLQTRSATPTTTERKQQFRGQLVTKRNAANAKAKSIFNLTINQIKKKDDVQERRQVKQIRQNQKTQVTALNISLSAQLRSIAANEKAAENRVNDRYTNRINPLARERAALLMDRAMAKTVAQRNKLTRRINSIQDEINALSRSRQSALAAIDARFDSREDAANNLFSTRIKNAKASAQRQILAAHRAWKSLFREEFADAKEKRSDNFELISGLRASGASYIDQMPLRTPAAS